MDNGNLDNIIFVLLFSADEPLTMRRLTSILEDTPASDIRASIEMWRKKLDEESWSIVFEKVAGGYQLSSRPEYAPWIARLYSGRRKMRLSKAALETLAIIAYKQPITRAEIENVRGVACGGVIANLMERTLIRITGKAKILGAPYLYGTTQEFLEYLGLNSLKDLPSMEELEALLEREESAVGQEESPRQDDGVAGAGDETGENPDEWGEKDVGDGTEGAEAEEPAVLTSAASLGPDVEEPYHRPLGGPGNVPVRVERDDAAAQEEPDESAGADEKPSDSQNE